jgi:hypothetical protein
MKTDASDLQRREPHIAATGPEAGIVNAADQAVAVSESSESVAQPSKPIVGRGIVSRSMIQAAHIETASIHRCPL